MAWPQRLMRTLQVVQESSRQRRIPCHLSTTAFQGVDRSSSSPLPRTWLSSVTLTSIRSYNCRADTLHNDRILYYDDKTKYENANSKSSQNDAGQQEDGGTSTRRHHNHQGRHRKGRHRQHRQRQGRHHSRNNKHQTQLSDEHQQQVSLFQFRDERLPCRQHLDPDGSLLPTSEWVHLNGTLPLSSLDEVVTSIEQILYEELVGAGVVDLDAMWHPLQDEEVPTVPIVRAEVDTDNSVDHDDDDSLDQDLEDNIENLTMEEAKGQTFHVQAAHVVLSPFGRPTGWHVKLASSSMVNALIVRAASKLKVRVGWKMVQVHEYNYPRLDDATSEEEQRKIKRQNHINNLPIDDTMVRFENCHPTLSEEHLRFLLSRFELARTGGATVIRWKGVTDDGKRQLMFVVRFLDASWARAAVRENQGLEVYGKDLRLIQFPKQLLFNEELDIN